LLVGSEPSRLLGTSPEHVLPPAVARERKLQLIAALREGRVAIFINSGRAAAGTTASGRWTLVRSAARASSSSCTNPLSPPTHRPTTPPTCPLFLRPAPSPIAPPLLLTRAIDLGDLAVLSKRELEVLYYRASGLTVNQIAAELFRSAKTIGRHTENIHCKRGYANRAELVRDATARGLVALINSEWTSLIETS
jgi:DNA-binding CsgD family transcriptional regulator